MTMRRVPNDQLRALLAEAGWTGDALARTVNAIGLEAGVPLRYGRASVTHWLSGMRPRPPVPQLVAEAFSRRLNRRVTTPETGLGQPGAPARETQRWWETGSAAEVLGQVGSSLASPVYNLAALPIPWTEPRTDARPKRRAGTPTKVGRDEVRVAREMGNVFAESDTAFGGGFARVALRGYLNATITPWLRADATPAVRRNLLLTSAELAYLCGFMCFDDELHGAAQRYYLASLRLAEDAGDAGGCAIALRALSVQAVHLRHHQQAVQLADAAVRTAANHVSAQTRAFLYGQLAVAHAATRDRRTALTHLADAERLLEKAANETHVVGAYHQASLAHQIAGVTYWLGERRTAVAALQRSVRQRPAGERRARAITLAWLAELQLADGYLEQACAAWHQFLDDYPYLRSRRATQALTKLMAWTRPYQNNPVARALRGRAAALRSSA